MGPGINPTWGKVALVVASSSEWLSAVASGSLHSGVVVCGMEWLSAVRSGCLR